MRHRPAFAPLAHAVWLGLVVLAGAGASSAMTGAALEGQRIIRIDLDVPPDTDTRRIRETIQTREGDTYRPGSVRRDVAALYALGQFEDVRADAYPADDGVRLVFRVRERPRVRAIRFVGDVKLSERKLREVLETQVGETVRPFLLKMDLEAVREHYRTEGYLFAEVGQETETVEGEVNVVYRVQAGVRLRVEAVRFEGNEAIADRELKRLMISVKSAGLLSKGRYEPALLRSDLLAIRELFRRKGYLDATVGHEILFDEAMERVYLVVRIRQGPLYEVERLIVRGNRLFDTDEILDAMTLRPAGPFSQEQLVEDIWAVERLYGRRGYVKRRIRVGKTFAEDRPAVTLTLNIEEGPRCTVNKVMIRGNRRTKDHVVRREVTLIPGDTINMDEMDETKRRLFNTGLFYSMQPVAGAEPVRVRLLDTEEPDKMDVIVEVTEGSMVELGLSAGWSSAVGPIGNIRLSHRNFDALNVPRSWRDVLRGDAFTGGGQKLTLSLSPGTEFRDYRLSWLNPSIYDSPYSGGFDVYYRDFEWFQYYDDSRAGLGLTFGRRYFRDLAVRLSPRIERVGIDDVDDGAPNDARDAEGTYDRRSLTLSASYDKRDNVFMPADGYKLSASVEMAGTLLGGEVDFLRETFEARWWRTVWDQKGWGKHVINVGGEMSLLHTTSSESVPIFDRLFMGGLGSVRGFRYRRVGPVDPATERQIGGEYMLVLNTEYEAPLVRDTLRGVVFADAGMLERSLGDVSFDRMRASVGAGIRLRLPQLGMHQVPIGLYFSLPIQREDTDKTEAISFTIGTGFEF